MTDRTITLKPTSTSLQSMVIEFEGGQKVIEIKQKIMEHYSVEYHQVKMIFKGRVLNDDNKLEQAKIVPGSVIMLVINKKTDSPHKKQAPQDQTIHKVPGTFNTGMGASMPVGFGGYSLINHPQYMSAMSGAVASEQNLQQFLNDPTYQGMMQQLMNDPDTLRQMMQQNPMLKTMMRQNPQLKMIMDNPELMKMVLNKDTIKMAQQVMKNNKNGGENPLAGMNMGGMNMGGFGGMRMPGLFGQMNASSQTAPNSISQESVQQPSNQYKPIQNNPQNPMMGSMGNPMGMGMNPFFMNMWGQQNRQQSQNKQQPGSIQAKYKSQMAQIESMGFKDREQILKALIESKGDVDGALQRLCQD